MKRFLSLDDADDRMIDRLLATARRLQTEPIRRDLAGKVLGLLFLNPSVRTLASFQAGMAQLGGHSFVISPGSGSWKMEWRSGVRMDGEPAEHFREAIPVLEQFSDALAMRSFGEGLSLEADLAEPILGAAGALTTKPFINLESALDHPCQALADWKTMDDVGVPRARGRIVLSWASHPKPLPIAVPNAVMRMAARRGMELVVLRPEGFGLPERLMAEARSLASRSGGSVEETDDRNEAMRGAHVLYAKSWQAPSAYGDREREAELRRRCAGDWTVDESWFETANPGARFMHCLPVRRNVVVADAVLDGPRSVVIPQAGNRLHVQKAILLALLGGKLEQGEAP